VQIEDEQELVAAERAVAVRKTETAVELGVMAEPLVDAGHANEDNPQAGAVVLVAEERAPGPATPAPSRIGSVLCLKGGRSDGQNDS
jgi:hypothetical protein